MWEQLHSLVYFGMLKLPSELSPVFSCSLWLWTSNGRLLRAPHRVSIHSTYRVFSEIICWLQISKCRSVNAPVEEKQCLSALRAREIYTLERATLSLKPRLSLKQPPSENSACLSPAVKILHKDADLKISNAASGLKLGESYRIRTLSQGALISETHCCILDGN